MKKVILCLLAMGIVGFLSCHSRTGIPKSASFPEITNDDYSTLYMLESGSFMGLLQQSRFISTGSICFELGMATVLLSKYQLANLKLFLFQNGNNWNLCQKEARSIISISKLNQENLVLTFDNLRKKNGTKNKKHVIGWSWRRKSGIKKPAFHPRMVHWSRSFHWSSSMTMRPS